jgi:hypothetical protein
MRQQLFSQRCTQAEAKFLLVDAGSYILTSTVTIPSGAKIVGETWSQLVSSGSYFSDARYVMYHRLLYLLGNTAPLYQSTLSSLTIYYSKPQVLIKVGNAGDIGSVEMQDFFLRPVVRQLANPCRMEYLS